MRCLCFSEPWAVRLSRGPTALSGLLLGLSVVMWLWSAPPARAAERGKKIIVAQGEAYRVATYSKAAAVEVALQSSDSAWRPLTRTGGEMAWFGYNRKSAGEVRSSTRAAKIQRLQRAGAKIVAVSCELEPGVLHRAEYVAFDDFCIVTSELRAAKPPRDATLIRLAPRFDINIRRLFCYALRDGRDILHTGTLAALGNRPKYVGVRGWGDGCTVAELSARRAYLAFFNPSAGPLFAVVYPHYRSQWRWARTFLQLFNGGANYLYAGVFDRGHFNQPVAFAIYARRDGDLAAFEQALPEIERRLDDLVRSSALRLPTVGAEIEAAQRLGQAAGWKAPASAAGRRDRWIASWKRWWALSAAARALQLGQPLAARDILSSAGR